MRFVKIGIACGAFGGLLAVSPFAEHAAIRWLSFIVVFAGLITPAIAVRKRLREDWFLARAVAESAKSLWWQCFSLAGVFASVRTDDERRIKYRDLTQKVLQDAALQGLALVPDATIGVDPLVFRAGLAPTQWREYYLRHRLENQRTWYTQRASYNGRQRERVFWYYLVVALGVLVAAAGEAAGFLPVIGAAGAFGALGSGVLAWVELNRFEELFQSYAVAAQELSLAAEMSVDELSWPLERLAGDVEEAISREHKFWVVRRMPWPNMSGT